MVDIKSLTQPTGLYPHWFTGISGEKVEIDPVTNQKASTKFWIKQKPISIDSDLLCACDLVEEKSPSMWYYFFFGVYLCAALWMSARTQIEKLEPHIVHRFNIR